MGRTPDNQMVRQLEEGGLAVVDVDSMSQGDPRRVLRDHGRPFASEREGQRPGALDDRRAPEGVGLTEPSSRRRYGRRRLPR